MNGYHATNLDKITSALRASLDRNRVIADAEATVGSIAAHRVMLDVQGALEALSALRLEMLPDVLAASLPALSGGAPHADDFEDIDPVFVSCPDEWPGIWHPELDGYIWEPAPEHILARGFSDSEAVRSDADWDDLYAASYPDLVTDADLQAAGLAVG